MTMKWMGLADDQEKLKSLDKEVNRAGGILHWYTDKDGLDDAMMNHSGAVVLFLSTSPHYDIYEIGRAVSENYPLAFIIMIGPKEHLDATKAVRTGARDLLIWPLNELEVRQVVEDALRNTKVKIKLVDKGSEEEKNGKVITVCSAKGGVGKTTCTVNLAVMFSEQKRKVAVVDLDLQFGDVAIMFDEKPKKTIYEWTKEKYGHARDDFDEFFIRHKSGVDIFAAPHRPEFADEIKEEHVKYLIDHLKRRYDIVLIDTPPYLKDCTLSALENSQVILLVTSMDLPSLKDNKLCIETLDSLHLKDRIKVVLNRESKVKGLQPHSVEKIFGLPIEVKIPSVEKIVVPSVNTGIPFVLSHPRSPISKAIKSLALKLATQRPAAKKSPFVNRLKLMFKG